MELKSSLSYTMRLRHIARLWNNMKLLLLLGSLLAGVSNVAAQEHGTVWFSDFDVAVEAALAQDKDLLVDFTGSDW